METESILCHETPTDSVFLSMLSFCSKLLEFPVLPCIHTATLKTLRPTLITQDLPHIPLCPSSHWISLSKSCRHFHYFDALQNLYCPIPTPRPLFAALLFSLHRVKTPSSPFGSISASFLQLVIHFGVSVIPGLIIHLFAAATSSCCFLKNGTPFWGDAVILPISAQGCLYNTRRVSRGVTGCTWQPVIMCMYYKHKYEKRRSSTSFYSWISLSLSHFPIWFFSDLKKKK